MSDPDDDRPADDLADDLAIAQTIYQRCNTCSLDVLLVLHQLPSRTRMTAKQIRAVMEAQEKCWGLCTVQMAMRDLLDDGCLDNRYDHRGYRLTRRGRVVAEFVIKQES